MDFAKSMAVSAGRSLQLSSEGIAKAQKALVYKSFSQNALAKELQITRQTISKFFRGQKVDRQYFVQISEYLDLDWEELTAKLPNELEPVTVAFQEDALEAIVQRLQQQGCDSIQHKYGMMRVLDMSQPVALSDIYVDVKVSEKITGRRWLEPAELTEFNRVNDVERLNFSKIYGERISGIAAVEKYSKLMVLGKPGSGKSTFLKYLAIQCNSNQLKFNKLPIFIVLKEFASAEDKPDLQTYIRHRFWLDYKIKELDLIEKLLSEGKVFFLLDGLDEVREEDSSRVIEAIRTFSDNFYTNHFVISCRVAANEYVFDKFTEVEIIDFCSNQIRDFVYKWFAANASNKAEQFIQKTQQNPAIQELATSPLLLTLLCSIFEESNSFPSNRSELYQEGLELLLNKWDARRNVERSQSGQLSLKYKEDLLSQIALLTFEQKKFFIQQNDIEQYIGAYVRNLLGSDIDTAGLPVDSKAIIQAIEAQHGILIERAKRIYSFSHLTFHEYLTAKAIVSSLATAAQENALNCLTIHISDKRWREVFLLTASMLPKADYLLLSMKQKTDAILAEDQYLQKFLTWLSQKSRTVSSAFNLVIVRAFYIEFELARIRGLVGCAFDLARAFDPALARAFTSDLSLDLSLDRLLDFDRLFSLGHTVSITFERVLERAINRAGNSATEVEQALQQLKAEVPELEQDAGKFEQWWQANGRSWTEKLRAIIIQKRDIGHNWDFSEQQKKALKQYYYASQLLVECLNEANYITDAVRQEIEQTLLLPIAEIENSVAGSRKILS